MNSLNTENLSFVPPNRQRATLQNVTLSIKPESLTAVMGLNGSGKTTLIKLLSGYLKPSQGRVTLNDKTLANFTPLELAKQISVVPQDFPTEFPFSVKEFVATGLYPWKKSFFETTPDQKRIQETLEELDLSRQAMHKITDISGGERQRVLLARTLLQQTPIILLDEPLNHLDIKFQSFMLKKLRELCKTQKKTIIAAMHNIADVKNYFDEMILIKDGTLKHAGSVDTFCTPEILGSVFEMNRKDLCF